MATEKQIQANRNNAKKSTGPRTEQGKAASSQNALKHGLLARDAVLPGEDPAELTDTTPLITGGILDSISTLKLVTFLEEHFHVVVEAHEAGVDHLDTIAEITRLVARKRSAA